MEIGSVLNSGASFADRNPFSSPVSAYKAYSAIGQNTVDKMGNQSTNTLSVTDNKNSRNGGNKFKDGFVKEECQTCKNRKYQDGSDDSGVSFQTPTKVSKQNAMQAVRGHEQEHVVRNQAKAQREGRKVVSQSVTIHMGICPECGEVYVSGGTTRTTTKSDNSAKFDVGKGGENTPLGKMLDTVA